MLKEFKEFAIKGNMLDLAIGVIIGGAFGKIVDSLVKDVIMPITAMFGGGSFANLYMNLKVPDGVNAAAFHSVEEANKAGIVTWNYGSFITEIINFLIVAFCLFLIVKAANKLRKPAPEPEAPPTPEDVVLLTEIRDLLKK